MSSSSLSVFELSSPGVRVVTAWWAFAAMVTLGCGMAKGETGSANKGKSIRFNSEVLPILAENCFACHGFDAKAREAGLRLDTRDGAIENRDGAIAIVPGRPEASLLIERLRTTDADSIMPPPHTEKRLTPEQIVLLEEWIRQGAEYEKHWSFMPPRLVEPPLAEMTDEKENPPIDRFIRDKLREKKLTPSPQASPETLVRRLSLDLTGLPPTLEELERFLDQYRRDPVSAYADCVERLLASPHYGERWGRWWLDQARYADSNGYSIDAPRQIWKYRDWVIDALNRDIPFDQFTIEQIAGDLLEKASENQKIATGFHRNTQINQEGGIDKEQFRIDSVFDRVATTGTVWLGMTIGCAQCHDHKFDPISQKEYYQLFAFFNNQDEPTLKVYDESLDVVAVTAEFKNLRKRLEDLFANYQEEFTHWESQLTEAFKKTLPADVRKALAVPPTKRTFDQKRILFGSGFGSVESYRDANERYLEIDAILNKGTTTLVMAEMAKPRTTHILIKGDFTRPAESVEPATPSVLHPLPATPSMANRLDLARWIVSPDNPLTARVIVNRVWQQYFGRGIVETENDFGLLGSRPTHPELLDWLALEWIQSGWSLKTLHRWIVTSQTYRQSSMDRSDLRATDANNYYLARQRRLRLDGELVRDVALTASGMLSPKLGGPPVFPPIPEGVMGQGQVKRTWTVSRGDDRYRRGLYTFVYRATPPPALNVFDSPDGYSTCTRRNRSNTPLQSLTLMNDSAFFELAMALEKIIVRDGIDTAFRRCTARLPTERERSILIALDPLTAARTLLNLDETITRE